MSYKHKVVFFFCFFLFENPYYILIFFSHVLIHRLLLIKCLLSYLCFRFCFSSYSSLRSVCMAPSSSTTTSHTLHLFFCLCSCMGTRWEELEPPSCHSSRLQFDQHMIMNSVCVFISLGDTRVHLTTPQALKRTIAHHISCDIYSGNNISLRGD